MITMAEIARLTQVSQPTVSRVLNGSQTVSPDIRERVLACAREHDYQLNALAKGLQGSRTMLLGALVPDISDGFYARLARELEAEARDRGYSVLLFNSDFDPRREQEYLSAARRYRVDGLLAVPPRSGSAWLDSVKKLEIPVVAVTQRVEGLDSIYPDCEDAGGQAARHLAQRGYGRFLFIGRDNDAKYLGLRRGLEPSGLDRHATSVEYWNDQKLRNDLRAYFQRLGPRTGVFAHSDACALRVLSILRELHIPVPQQAGVIGFDGSFLCPYLNPPLSSVSLPVEEMARGAVARLISRIEDPVPQTALDRSLPTLLTVREST